MKKVCLIICFFALIIVFSLAFLNKENAFKGEKLSSDINRSDVKDTFAFYLQDENGDYISSSSIPTDDGTYDFKEAVCDGEAILKFDESDWSLFISNLNYNSTKCKLYFDLSLSDGTTWTITEDGTWTVPADGIYLVEIHGGGGGGGTGGYYTDGMTTYNNGGSGGGGSGESYTLSLTAGSQYDIKIGSGGTGGSSIAGGIQQGSNGLDGGTTYFGNLSVLGGLAGKGGTGGATAEAQGGAASGSLASAGENGTTYYYGGAGGAGGEGNINNVSQTFGDGGSGTYGSYDATKAEDGQPGAVIITYLSDNELDITFVEYLEVTGTQYINTLYTPQSENVEYEFSWNEPTLNSACTLFGSTNTNYSSDSNRWAGTHYKPNTTSLYSATGVTDAITTISNIVAGERNYGTTIIDNGTITRTQNGVTSTATYNGTIQNGVNIGIFADIRNSDVIEICKSVQLYYWKMKDDGILVRDMLPCIDSDGVACLYDKVTKTTFYNVGTGSFTTGPEL